MRRSIAAAAPGVAPLAFAVEGTVSTMLVLAGAEHIVHGGNHMCLVGNSPVMQYWPLSRVYVIDRNLLKELGLEYNALDKYIKQSFLKREGIRDKLGKINIERKVRG